MYVFFCCYLIIRGIYTVSPKNVTLCDCLLPNINRFSKFFHWYILWTTSNEVIIEYLATH